MNRRNFLKSALVATTLLACNAHATILAETPTGWTTTANFGGTDVCLYNDTTVTASSAGTAQNTIIYLPATAWDLGATTLKIRWYRQSTGALAGESTYSSADGTGAVTKALGANFAVGSSEQFYPLMVSNGTMQLSTNGGSFETFNPTGTYASPPSTINPATDPGGTRGKFRVALDGTVGGGTVINPIGGGGGSAARPVTFLRRDAANDDEFFLRAAR